MCSFIRQVKRKKGNYFSRPKGQKVNSNSNSSIPLKRRKKINKNKRDLTQFSRPEKHYFRLPQYFHIFHDRWKPVHKDSEWSPSQTLSMHHTLHLSSVMSSLCTERAAGKCSWPHTLHLNTVSRSPRTHMQGPLQIQRTIRLTVRSVNDNSQRGSLQTAVWALHSLMT